MRFVVSLRGFGALRDQAAEVFAKSHRKMHATKLRRLKVGEQEAQCRARGHSRRVHPSRHNIANPPKPASPSSTTWKGSRNSRCRHSAPGATVRPPSSSATMERSRPIIAASTLRTVPSRKQLGAHQNNSEGYGKHPFSVATNRHRNAKQNPRGDNDSTTVNGRYLFLFQKIFFVLFSVKAFHSC